MSDNIQFSPEKLAKFKSIIEEDLEVINKELTKFKHDREALKQHLAHTNTDFNQTSKHFEQQAKNKQLINRLQVKSRELKAALKRIENKTYGVCNRSGQLIREERLMARPVARFDIKRK